MAIAHYIKEIGRGKEGARPLSREQAADLMGQILDGHVSDLELGAFCVAMRIKGEEPAEMAGFLDAAHQRMARLDAAGAPTIVIPSYNGARKQPLLVPLMGLLLVQALQQHEHTRHCRVLIHGCATEDSRVFIEKVLAELATQAQSAIKTIAKDPHQSDTSLAVGMLHFAPTESLSPALVRLLQVRRSVGLRNPAHSLVKLMNPTTGPMVLVSSYTHPEYATSMADTLQLMGNTALLLRGTEGEAVADARRLPPMHALLHGTSLQRYEAQSGSLDALPTLPSLDAAATAQYTLQVMAGALPAPAPIATQVERIVRLAHDMVAA
ncbi:DNA-binding protein YbiB [Curvibacter sp. CHRR-16]|uniref:DNA-binding protein YbiB n=1 Tax=Curvibacter sp. CHRR-16 TaxID=2835872 RepID=UPI001BDB1479|nr:DNA-binding protein YbiB [Curvibacter sp. CHRR-16]MBT0571484.1 DNA-binding protein YbiB [Curvibacter sp. CHRR-16]